MEKEIKCHLCGGNAILQYENLELDNGKITIRESPFYKCTKCKEEYSTSEQMHELSNYINKKFVFKRTVINAGRSIAITIPTDLADYYGIKKGEEVSLIPDGKKHITIQLE